MSEDVNDALFPEEDQPVAADVVQPDQDQPEPDGAASAEPSGAGSNEGEDHGAPPAPEKEDAKFVPVTALTAERAKRQAVQAKLDEAEKWRRDFEARANEHRLSQIEDPDERLQAHEQQWQQAATMQKRDLSRMYAERQHGADFVNEVVEFFNDPAHIAMSKQFLQAPDPFGAAIDYYNANKALAEIGPDPKAYETRLRDQIKAEIMAEMSPAKPKAPPPSMTGAPASGGDKPKHGSGFDEMFGQ